MRLQWDIFVAFFRSGMLGFGGGPSTIPLVHKEVVGTFKWMNDQEFSEVLALGNTLPGPIATKMAGYIGYRVAGIRGMFNAVIATILPSILLMLLFLTSFNKVKDHPRVEGMTNGVIPIVGVMMATLTWDFIKKTKKGFGWKKGILLLFGSFIVMKVLNVHPGIVIGGLLILAISVSDKKGKIDILVKGNSESL